MSKDFEFVVGNPFWVQARNNLLMQTKNSHGYIVSNDRDLVCKEDSCFCDRDLQNKP